MTGADAAAVDTPWSAVALKRLFRVVGGSTPTQDPGNWDGDVCWVTPADLSGLEGFGLDQSRRTITPVGLSSCGTTLVPPGSLVLSTRAPIGSLGIAGRRLCTNQGCRSLVPRADLDTRYFAYFLSVTTGELNAIGRGSTFMELSGEDLGAFLVPSPPLSVQRDLAAFLDYETARIDELVQQQERLEQLIEERAKSRVDELVLRGADSWASRAVDDWVPLRYLSPRVTVGIVVQPSSYYVAEGGIPALRSFNVTDQGIEARDLVQISEAGHAMNAKSELRAGDLVMVRTGRPGLAAVVEKAHQGWNCIDLILIRKCPRVDSYFLSCVLNSDLVRSQIAELSAGSIQQHFNVDAAKSLRVPVPPHDVQAAVAAEAARIQADVAASRATVRRGIELLVERRSALVTAAVTGQIDVSSWRPPDDWLVPEPA